MRRCTQTTGIYDDVEERVVEYVDKKDSSRALERKDTNWLNTKGKPLLSELFSEVEYSATVLFDFKFNTLDVLSNVDAFNNIVVVLMNNLLGEVYSPSGKRLSFVPRRRDIGVRALLSDPLVIKRSYNDKPTFVKGALNGTYR